LRRFRVITARNPVHAVLYLVLAFFQAAAIWILLKAEFLAIALVLVYVGAVMVLFLFVVMMLDINTETLSRGFWKHFPLAALIGAVVALEMAYVLLGGFRLAEEPKACSGRVGPGQRSRRPIPGIWASAVHAIPVSPGNRCRHPAGGHDRGHRADLAGAQGQQVCQRHLTRSV
jgi:NADH-quinone oxidoreductase subunit J